MYSVCFSKKSWFVLAVASACRAAACWLCSLMVLRIAWMSCGVAIVGVLWELVDVRVCGKCEKVSVTLVEFGCFVLAFVARGKSCSVKSCGFTVLRVCLVV